MASFFWVRITDNRKWEEALFLSSDCYSAISQKLISFFALWQVKRLDNRSLSGLKYFIKNNDIFICGLTDRYFNFPVLHIDLELGIWLSKYSKYLRFILLQYIFNLWVSCDRQFCIRGWNYNWSLSISLCFDINEVVTINTIVWVCHWFTISFIIVINSDWIFIRPSPIFSLAYIRVDHLFKFFSRDRLDWYDNLTIFMQGKYFKSLIDKIFKEKVLLFV